MAVLWFYASARRGETSIVLECDNSIERDMMMKKFITLNMTTFKTSKLWSETQTLLTFSTQNVAFPEEDGLQMKKGVCEDSSEEDEEEYDAEVSV